jgi:transcriptional regulator with XRE-family HTH domain
MEPGPQALADYVREHAPAAGYTLTEWGEPARLARDSGMDTGTLTRILKGERVPRPAQLWPLSQALGRPFMEVMVVSGTVPPESVAHMPQPAVASTPITADALADEWGVHAEGDRAYIAETLKRLREHAKSQKARQKPEHGSSAANG